MRDLARIVHRLASLIFLSQSLLLAFLVVGWTYRLLRRTVVRSWWSRGGRPGTFAAFAGSDEATRTLATWPRLLRSERAESDVRRLGALRDNARTGLAGLTASLSLTLPAGGLWLLGWHFGWDNSFNKGYEQHAQGLFLGWLGIALFLAAMLYLPLAQARHAVTGELRRFFDVRLIARLARSRPWSLVGLALLYTMTSAPLTILRIAPAFFARNGAPGSRAQVVLGLDVYYLFAGALLVPAYIILRALAARIYAGAVADGVRRGRVPLEWLAPFERTQLGRLGLLVSEPPSGPRASPIRLMGARVASAAGSLATVGALMLIWFSFVAQIFVLEFFHFQPMAWLNQPLLHLPWIRLIPGAGG